MILISARTKMSLTLESINKSPQDSNGTLKKSFEDLFKEMPVEKDIRCGYSFFSGRFLQK